jgi:hypothetical protein
VDDGHLLEQPVAKEQVRHRVLIVDDHPIVQYGLSELELVDLSAVTREVVERFREDMDRSGTTPAVMAAPPVTGVWDRMRIEQSSRIWSRTR